MVRKVPDHCSMLGSILVFQQMAHKTLQSTVSSDYQISPAEKSPPVEKYWVKLNQNIRSLVLKEKEKMKMRVLFIREDIGSVVYSMH